MNENKYILTWATKERETGAVLCGYECVASLYACKRIVRDYKNRADHVLSEWEGAQYPYGIYTELVMADGTQLLLCIEPLIKVY